MVSKHRRLSKSTSSDLILKIIKKNRRTNISFFMSNICCLKKEQSELCLKTSNCTQYLNAIIEKSYNDRVIDVSYSYRYVIQQIM